jgi:hypothetical protein
MAVQNQWRFCFQCKVLYFDGHPQNKGVCRGAPAGRPGHRPAGFNFVLPFNVPATPNSQPRWLNCWKCQAMYFDGHADGNKGKCPQGGMHDGHFGDPRTFNFVLPFNVPATPTAQDHWRNCWKCQAMFFDGFADQGRCAAGGAHEGHGDEPRTFNFVLPHPITPSVTLRALRDEDGRFLFVRGTGFSPNHNVTVVYTYTYFPSGSTSQRLKDEGTNVQGDFTSELDISSDLSGANVRVIDHVTRTEASSPLLRSALLVSKMDPESDENYAEPDTQRTYDAPLIMSNSLEVESY